MHIPDATIWLTLLPKVGPLQIDIVSGPHRAWKRGHPKAHLGLGTAASIGHLPLGPYGCSPFRNAFRQCPMKVLLGLPGQRSFRCLTLWPWDKAPHLLQYNRPLFQCIAWDLWIFCPAHIISEPRLHFVGMSGSILSSLWPHKFGPGHGPLAMTLCRSRKCQVCPHSSHLLHPLFVWKLCPSLRSSLFNGLLTGIGLCFRLISLAPKWFCTKWTKRF